MPLTSTLILSCRLSLDLRGSLFYSVRPAKALCIFPLFPRMQHARPITSSSALTPKYFFGDAYKSWSSELCSLLQNYFPLLPFKPKYLHSYPIFEHSAYVLSLIWETKASSSNISKRYILISSSYLPTRTPHSCFFHFPDCNFLHFSSFKIRYFILVYSSFLH